ncbi:hypothetical protein EDE08_103519 [Bradyrhizobium sp. R2.2-H]|jgi:hypothetical protein|uniref:hypothetical protein n=1 Tax=unclassified Bradyrhizobium TaxID=2631580 RepID=UPI001044ACA4|nr:MULTISPECIES: hypothetical protein [unclassified Bradyrhizobium]TCU75299.1 hypothetical protein EDE10_103518 [Bradyrhizobium sp. Y-H1]TCU78067.1 hypothetical protein EDE08_103519 [Bradyrhizobium sp. R2.2-H]
MTKKIEARLAAVQRKLNAKHHPTDNTFRILIVHGGLPGPIDWAYGGAHRWRREPGEELEAFTERAAAAAIGVGERALNVGGLPRSDELAGFSSFEEWWSTIAPHYDDVPPEQARGSR